jgi:hypothetical protein
LISQDFWINGVNRISKSFHYQFLFKNNTKRLNSKEGGIIFFQNPGLLYIFLIFYQQVEFFFGQEEISLFVAEMVNITFLGCIGMGMVGKVETAGEHILASYHGFVRLFV